jgi:hypothetical protein
LDKCGNYKTRLSKYEPNNNGQNRKNLIRKIDKMDPKQKGAIIQECLNKIDEQNKTVTELEGQVDRWKIRFEETRRIEYIQK